MKNTAKLVTTSALAILTLATPGMGAGPGRENKRVWTNDDFAPAPSRTAAVVAPAPPAPAAAARELSPQLSEVGLELNEMRQSIQDEMVANARVRDKAYDDSVSIIKNRLEAETDPFRMEVLKKLLGDTVGLKAMNKKIVEQFERKPEPKQDAVSAEKN